MTFYADAVRSRKGSRTTSFERRLADLYGEHAGAALRLAFLLTRDADVAEDVCQEAFVRLGGRLGRLRDPERAAGYLFRIVVNLSRGHGRRMQRARATEERLGTTGHPAAPDPTAHDEITRALLQLPLRQRAAIFFRYFEDLSERQTADALGCTVGAVRSLTFRAFETLRRDLQEVDR